MRYVMEKTSDAREKMGKVQTDEVLKADTFTWSQPRLILNFQIILRYDVTYTLCYKPKSDIEEKSWHTGYMKSRNNDIWPGYC